MVKFARWSIPIFALLAACEPGELQVFTAADGSVAPRLDMSMPSTDGFTPSDDLGARPDGFTPPSDAGCDPDCTGRACGPDGCGGSCGDCGAGQACEPGAGQCIDTESCGNGSLDPGEVCDGDCPTSCPAPATCETIALQGTAAECTARCVTSDISSCTNGDGCCPSGCNATNDNDCDAMCGNGVVEPGERCDGDCPTSCSSSACTTRTLVGSGCNRRCESAPVTTCASGDGCCPSGCSLPGDADCALDCTDLGSWPSDWAAQEDAALDEMNRHRATGYTCASGPRMSVPAYVMNDQLRIAARCHSMDMAEENFFSHTGSDGSNFSTRCNRAGYTGGPRYENIAAGNSTGVASVGQWMSSSTGHCDAVMASNANRVGIGYYRKSGTMWTHYWTAVFGQGG
ncbi:MAG: CAP domain-containing protein [Deltaproteobacteria bacterium]|nr:CAP domain-containing protein [Deltaproteobacteria bacterium]